MIERIVSGGQTGVDRAALDVALELQLPCGGWCPRGRRAEDGRIPPMYPLKELRSFNYAHRTGMNVDDSDGTLIITGDELSGGTALTVTLARRKLKPVLVVDLREETDVAAVEDWLALHKIRTLNVAGPRESQQPGIHERATCFLTELLSRRDADANGHDRQ